MISLVMSCFQIVFFLFCSSFIIYSFLIFLIGRLYISLVFSQRIKLIKYIKEILFFVEPPLHLCIYFNKFCLHLSMVFLLCYLVFICFLNKFIPGIFYNKVFINKFYDFWIVCYLKEAVSHTQGNKSFIKYFLLLLLSFICCCYSCIKSLGIYFCYGVCYFFFQTDSELSQHVIVNVFNPLLKTIY